MERKPRRKKKDEELIPRKTPGVAQFLVDKTPDLTDDQRAFILALAKLPSIDPATAAVDAGLHPDIVFDWLEDEECAVARCVEYVRQAWLADHEAILSVSCFRTREVRGKAGPAQTILKAHHMLYGVGKADVAKGLEKMREGAR